MTDFLRDKKYTTSELKGFLKAYNKATDAYTICSITDIKGYILHANARFCEISKYSEKELIGNKHVIMTSNYHSKEYFKNMWECISNGNEWRGNLKNKAKDGTEFWLDTLITPIINTKGIIQQYFSINTLITEKKDINAKKNKNLKDLQELLRMLSHEVRKPITNLLGISNIYTKIPPDSQELKILMN
jgi:PAS domain S-box-containing protein